jgi:putative peptidoglycan lipid II flippase
MAEKRMSSQPFLSGEGNSVVSEKKAMTRAAGVVGLWTVLSRVLGFARDVVIALFLGAGPGADAFFVAFRIPNLLRRLFAEGALSAAFIPTFVETLHKDGRVQAAQLARVACTVAAIILALVTLAGILFSSGLVQLIAPGFLHDAAKFQLTVDLNRIMFPYIFFISLVALASGVLNSMGRFAAPAAAPALLNICMIASVVLFSTVFHANPVYELAWGVVAAGVMQLALQIPFIAAEGIRLRPNFNFRHPALKRMGVLFLPAAFGGAVYQINVMVGTILASMLPVGGVSWLYYADRLVELPLGVFAIALGTAVLPSMSRQAADGDMAGLTHSVSFALRIIAFFTIPASVALILLGEPIIAVLFQRGLFTVTDTQQTTLALVWYTAGLWAFSGLKVVTQAFYSLKDTRTPVWVAIGAVIVNLVVGLLLMGPMQQGGLALATSLAAAFNVAVLFAILIKRLGSFPSSYFSLSIARMCAASAVMAIPLLYLRTLGDWTLGSSKLNVLVLVATILVGLVTFAGAAYVLRCREMHSMLEMLGICKKKK